MTCAGFAFGAAGLAGILAAGRPPLGFVVPSRAKSLSASSLRPARRAAAAAFLCAHLSFYDFWIGKTAAWRTVNIFST
jgi:hypothetical protein